VNGPDRDRPASMADDWKKGLNLAQFLLRVLSFPIELYTRRPGTRGRDNPDPPVILIALIFLPMALPALVPVAYGLDWYLLHWGLMFVASLVHNVSARLRKVHIHRHYIGDPHFGNGRTRWAETLLGATLAGIGFILCNTLGWLLLLGTLASRLELELIHAREKRQLELMKDAQIEAEYLGEQLRNNP